MTERMREPRISCRIGPANEWIKERNREQMTGRMGECMPDRLCERAGGGKKSPTNARTEAHDNGRTNGQATELTQKRTKHKEGLNEGARENQPHGHLFQRSCRIGAPRPISSALAQGVSS